MTTITHWQHQPHDAAGTMVSEFVITHAGRTIVDASYTFACPRADCAGVPEGIKCDCAPTQLRPSAKTRKGES